MSSNQTKAISCHQHEANMKEWWDEARQSDEPPTVAAMFCSILWQNYYNPAVFSLCKQAMDEAANTHQYGRVAFLLKDLSKVYKRDYEVQQLRDTLQQQVFPKIFVHYISEEDLWVMLGAVGITADGPRPYACGLYCFKKTTELIALRQKYSKKLRNVILHHSVLTIPQGLLTGELNTDLINHGIDGVDLLESVLPHVQSCITPKSCVWKDEILVEFLRILSKCPHLNRLEILDGEVPATESGIVEPVPCQQFLDRTSACGVQHLIIDDTALVCQAKSEVVFWNYVIKHMPSLKFLYVTRLTTPSRHVPYLVKLLLECNHLERLLINNCYVSQSSKTSGKEWLPLFSKGLKHNRTLKSFEFTRNTSIGGLTICLDAMLDVLKHNTTLTRVFFGNYNGTNMDVQYHHYTDLNEWGRAKARNPATTLSEWTSLLEKVIQELERCSRHGLGSWGMAIFDRNAVNRIFGLIQESPSITKYFSTTSTEANAQT